MTPQDEPKAKDAPMCSELRCKGMYVVKGAPTEDLHVIPGDTTHWWCERTQYSIGPDKDLVDRSLCTPGRTCYQSSKNPS